MPEPQQPFGAPEPPPPPLTAAESLVLAELERADVMSARGVSKADLARRIVAAMGRAGPEVARLGIGHQLGSSPAD